MLRATGCDVFTYKSHTVLDVYLGTGEDTVRYTRKSIPIVEWDLMDKVDVVAAVHELLQALQGDD